MSGELAGFVMPIYHPPEQELFLNLEVKSLLSLQKRVIIGILPKLQVFTRGHLYGRLMAASLPIFPMNLENMNFMLNPRMAKARQKKYKLNGAGFYDSPVWSPDSQKIVFADNSWSLYWIDLKTGTVKKIASEYLLGPSRVRSVYASWSPDSRWIAYTLNTQTYIQKVFVYSLEKDKSFPITDGLSEVAEPVFDPSGKYLYFISFDRCRPSQAVV